MSSTLRAQDSQTDTAPIYFVVPIVLSSPTNLDFGQINHNIGYDQKIFISPAGVVSGNGAGSHLGGQAAGTVQLEGGTQQIDIHVNQISSNNASSFTLSTPRCMYDGGEDLRCSGSSGYSITPVDTSPRTLAIGLRLKAFYPIAGVYEETFTVNAVYN